jgi:predicted nucleotidyltransferase
VDYEHPVETLIPGVQGRVLGVLARTEMSMSMRQVAKLAHVSQSQAAEVLGVLTGLGLVERRDVGRTALVRLEHRNAAAQVVLQLAGLHRLVLEQLREEAKLIDPPPVSLVVFGSFAVGNVTPSSDVDVLAVRGEEVDEDHERWTKTLGRWVDFAGDLAGNPVNLLDVTLPDLARMDAGLWRAIGREGVTLAGAPGAELRARRGR